MTANGTDGSSERSAASTHASASVGELASGDLGRREAEEVARRDAEQLAPLEPPETRASLFDVLAPLQGRDRVVDELAPGTLASADRRRRPGRRRTRAGGAARRRACGSTRARGTSARRHRASRGRSPPAWPRASAPRRACAAAAARDRGRASRSSHSRRTGRSCCITRDVRLNPRVSSRSAAPVRREVEEAERGESLLRDLRGERPRPRASRAAARRRASRGSTGPRLWCDRWSASKRSTAVRSARSRYPRTRARRVARRRIGRERVRLLLVPELEPVLDGAQEEVGLGEPAGVRRLDVAAVRQLLERVERGGGADRLVVAAVDELQELDRELDVADPAAPSLELAVGETLAGASRLRRAPSSPAPPGPRPGRAPRATRTARSCP